MHVTIETPLRRNSAHLACVHGIDRMDEIVMLEIAEFCRQQMTDDDDNRSTWRIWKNAAEGIVNNDLIPEGGSRCLGPFYVDSLVIPSEGDTIIVNAGARLFSTHPKIPQSGDVAKRRQDVKVHRVSSGCYDDWHGPRVMNMEVHWAGTGGYWKWTNLENITIAPPSNT